MCGSVGLRISPEPYTGAADGNWLDDASLAHVPRHAEGHTEGAAMIRQLPSPLANLQFLVLSVKFY